MDKTKIEWADSTWNPVTGCYHDCPYCYARTMVKRFAPHYKNTWIQMDNIRTRKSELGFLQSIELQAPVSGSDGKRLAYPTGFIPTLHRYRLDDYRNKKPRTIFVCSMADLFGEWVPDEWIEEVFAACAKAPQHRYLFLTKNPGRYKELAMAGKLSAADNMYYGTTATTPDQEYFWGGAWHTFVSIEPIMRDYAKEIGKMCETFASWVIVGAETGNRKEKIVPKPEWIEEIIYTCASQNICLMMKESLLPIVGEENMFRELPWDESTWETKRLIGWLDNYYERHNS